MFVFDSLQIPSGCNALAYTPLATALFLLLLISTVRMLPTPGGYTALFAFPRDVLSAPLGKRLVTVSITTCMGKW
jgi:hypothetical protein